jgi:hypothetical protein
VTGAEIHVAFDPTKLHAQSVSATGSFMPNVLTAGASDNAAGAASIVVGSSTSKLALGKNSVATITFKALASGSSDVSYAATSQTASVGSNTSSLGGTSGSSISTR